MKPLGYDGLTLKKEDIMMKSTSILLLRPEKQERKREMNTIDWVRKFKFKILARIKTKTGWGNVQLEEEVNNIYMEILEEMINPEEK
jgi:hypothetical protein